MIDLEALEVFHKENFTTLCQACNNGDLVLVPTTRKSDGVKVALLCAVSIIEEGKEEMCIVPLAVMIEDNPYELFEDPSI